MTKDNSIYMTAPLAVTEALLALADPRQAAHHRRFFKTGPGEYGEGDKFLGLTVPQVRSIAKRCRELDLNGIRQLLGSPWHEVRLCALQIMVMQFRKGDEMQKAGIAELYLQSTEHINNWDLVDLSVNILGEWYLDKVRAPLYRLAYSASLWERRMAMVATHVFIKNGEFRDALAIAEILLSDRHDLTHKAVGWMLREVGKKDIAALKVFLAQHYRSLPRTSLRYAIERFPETERLAWLKNSYGY